VFKALPQYPDHPALEVDILDWWEETRIFDRLRERNRGGPHWSFFDGPKTANTTAGLGVHHLWGRTYKDVFQRYKALQGFDQRYQNGFDCQGLWVEVKVERDLGLNSKREIEEYGLDSFADRCRELVAESARVITQQSIRLGQWMDWGNDYYTFSDTNIEYIWRFLKTLHDRGSLYQGHRSTEWCPRCGTSISQHELSQSDVYRDKSDPSLFVRFPLHGRDRESLVVWTTTPWTLPANVAAAVNPEAEYGRRDTGEWVAVQRFPDDTFLERVRGSQLVGLEYDGPYDHFAAAKEIVHHVIPWDEVSLDEGTGIVHIAPGAGTEDFELSKVHDLPVLIPVDESGRFLPEYGWLHGTSTGDAADQIVGDLRERGLLEHSDTYVHRYPHCWRCETPLIFRVVDDWFIAVEELRPKLLDANASVKWTPAFYGKRMDDWLRNLGDWNISRKRYYGLPLPIYPCSCGRVNVIGSKAELEERATAGLEQLQELHRPWVDKVTIRCDSCGEEVTRVPEVGDVWLDAGIVPFSTLGWQNPEWITEGYATGAAKGLTRADLPDHAYWEKWFPAHWVTEMREQIRLWFYSLLFMSVVLDGRAPYQEVLGHEDVRDEHGHEMHGSRGNTIEAQEALSRMGADVMRWMYCEQAPTQGVKFGYTAAGEIKRRLLTLWNSVKFFDDYPAARPLAPRTYRHVGRGHDWRLRTLLDTRRHPVLHGFCRRSVELVHPPLTASLLERGSRGFADVMGRPHQKHSGDRACHALLRRPPVARPANRGPTGVGVSRALAGARRARRAAARGGRGGAARGRAGPAGARRSRAQAAAAATPTGRPGSRAGEEPRRRNRGGAARQGGRVRTGRGNRAACEAEPSRARTEARQGARRGPGGASGRAVRAARGRRVPRERA
jgi:isoleucyl-tRNA synthetase